MSGGEDSADTWCVDARLPDGLGAREGKETLEAGGKSGGGVQAAFEALLDGHFRPTA